MHKNSTWRWCLQIHERAHVLCTCACTCSYAYVSILMHAYTVIYVFEIHTWSYARMLIACCSACILILVRTPRHKGRTRRRPMLAQGLIPVWPLTTADAGARACTCTRVYITMCVLNSRICLDCLSIDYSTCMQMCMHAIITNAWAWCICVT